MSQTVKGRGDHVGFRIALKSNNTTLRGTFMAYMLTSHAAVLEKSKMSRLIRGQGFNRFKEIPHFKTPSGTTVVSLVTGHVVVLNKLK